MGKPNDRGTIKWTSLMLPEHVEAIQELWKEDKKIEKPILDEQKLEEIGQVLQLAMKDDLTVELQHHNGFDFSYTKMKITSIDTQTKRVRGIDQSDKLRTYIDFAEITDARIL
ncbi:YolD-like family protein [Halobacillus salinus]|uniref:YolD-like family protein n=1 Tax=Halobacillus salinus TaxID=192814 RepID=A0A4Z0H433_9BACI|nr:YolD-like family protein [Halobacillus salinus]TGB04674.1 YolD-like family protein [Halobacillus salinus]